MKFWKYEISLDPFLIVTGFLQGLGFYVLDRHMAGLSESAERAIGLFLIITPTALMLAMRPASRARDLVVAFGLGATFAGLYALLQNSTGVTGHGYGLLGGYSLTAVVSAFILLCFHQAGRDGNPRAIPYQNLFQAAWSNLLLLTLAAIFIGVVFLVLTLWGQLFNLIGLTGFKRLFAKDWFCWPFYGAAFGLGIALLRELDTPILAARRLILASFRVLAVIVALAGVLFLLALPFTGLAPLWSTRHATPILLSMVIAFVIFVNGAVQDGSEPRVFWRPAALLVKAFLVMLPAYGMLAFYSSWLRVDQYGLTPDRVVALVLAGLAVLYGLAYAAAVLLRRRGWVEGLTTVNPRLALVAVAVGILVHIPGIDPVSLSARNQLERLQTGKVAVTDFDFGALKFQLGKPGLRALDRISHDPKLSAREDVQSVLADLSKMTSINDWWQAQYKTRAGLRGKDLEKLVADLARMPVFPSSALMPDGFYAALADLDPMAAKACAASVRAGTDQTATQIPHCAVILLDFNRDGYDDVALWQGYGNLSLYLWDAARNSYQRPIPLAAREPITLDTIAAADKAGQIHTVPARVDNLMIGGARFE